MQKPSSVIGVCGLCRAEGVALCYSDLMPKAVVRWVRMSADPKDKNPNPIFVTDKFSNPINFRIAEHFLCPECEDLLNRCGETWTLHNAFRGGATFPLRDVLAQSPARVSLDKARLIDARSLSGVDLPRLIHFAIGVFWKASARRWWALDHPTQLEFGPYEERFRRYLLGQQAFPERASLIVSISGNQAPHLGAIYPYGGGRLVQGPRQYRFAIPGMAFWLHVGQIPYVLRELCAYHSGTVCLSPDLNEMFVRDMGPLVAKAKRRRAP